MSDQTEQIRILSAALPVGGSLRTICTKCGGGNSRERTLAITRTQSALAYVCHRASCNLSGYIGETPSAEQQQSEKRSIVRPYRGSTWGLGETDFTFFENRFHLLRSTLDGVRISEEGEYLFPIFSPIRQKRGYVLRQPSWSGLPACPRLADPGKAKAITYPEADEPMQSFYGPRKHDRLVVVEDQLSAMRIAQDTGVSAVALLGTGTNAAKVREWQLISPTEVIIALDEDATGNAFAMAKKWGMAFSLTRVAILARDLKDEAPGRKIAEALNL